MRNLRRDPAVSVLIFTKEFFGSWVQIDGRAEIVDQPAALDLLETVYRTIAGEHPDWNEYRQAMIRDERVVIRIHPERASGQVYLRQAGTSMTGTHRASRDDNEAVDGFRLGSTALPTPTWIGRRRRT